MTTTSKRIKTPIVKSERKVGRPKGSRKPVAAPTIKSGTVASLHKESVARIGKDYYNTTQWGIALNAIESGVVITAIEFYPKHPGRVRKVSGNVIHSFENAIPGMPLVQRTLLSVTWNHAGVCHLRGERMSQYDVTEFLKNPPEGAPQAAAVVPTTI